MKAINLHRSINAKAAMMYENDRTPNEKNMYTVPKRHITKIRVNTGTTGEPLHLKIERMLVSKEKIDKEGADSKPLIYTDKRDGVLPNTDIRTDKWEHAAASSTKLARDYINNRQKSTENKDGKTESTDGKGSEKPSTEADKG